MDVRPRCGCDRFDGHAERRKFVENSDKWGVGMAVVFIVALLLYPLFKVLGWL